MRELLRYNDVSFSLPESGDVRLPLPDEPFVSAWEDYVREAERRPVAGVLRERLVQLRFPIREGISRTETYRAATRRGRWPPDEAPGLELEDPGGLRLFLHGTAAGRIPVLRAERRHDFVALVRALARRNEPSPVPAAQGATMVAGYNNWDRVARLRAAFERGERFPSAESWEEAFASVRPRKELYQDRLILLSSGPYSGVDAADLGPGEEEWLRLSGIIRLEHECAHYFTRRVLGSMRNNLMDELIADYAGLVAASGRFRADWFLRFLGLRGPPRPAAGPRVESYRGTPPLSEGAFRVLHELVRRAARSVEEADSHLRPEDRSRRGRASVMLALATFTLEELAAPDAGAWLEDRLRAEGRSTSRDGRPHRSGFRR